MGDLSAPKLKRYLPHAIAATAAVIAAPIGIVSLLVGAGLIDSLLVTAPLAMLFSLAASSAGSAWWKKRPGAHELVFSDLMLWGWLRRLRTERRISRAVELLGNRTDLPSEQQVEYFKQLASALEARDPFTHGHTRRVTAHAVAIAERMGLSREEIAKVRTAAAIHDVGKLNTPREVLNKPGRLTDEEFAVIKRHPVDGAEMAARLGDDEITAMVLHHHERLDGTGYPSRLVGENIPLGARIIAVADTFDAVTSNRPYRGASSHKKGMAILSLEAGTQLDPDAVRAFRSHYSGLRGVALGSLISSGPGQLVPWGWGLRSAAPLAKTIAALAVAGALGTTAAGLAKPAPAGHPEPTVTARAARDLTPLASVASGRTVSHTVSPLRAAAPPITRRRLTRTRPSPVPTATSRPGTSTSPAQAAGGTGDGQTSGTSGSPSATRPSANPGGGSASGGGSGSGGGSSSGGGSTSGGGSSSGSGGPVSVSTSPPTVKVNQTSVTATTPAVTVSTPSVTVTTPVGTVKTPPVTVSTPSVTVSTPSVQLKIP